MEAECHAVTAVSSLSSSYSKVATGRKGNIPKEMEQLSKIHCNVYRSRVVSGYNDDVRKKLI